MFRDRPRSLSAALAATLVIASSALLAWAVFRLHSSAGARSDPHPQTSGGNGAGSRSAPGTGTGTGGTRSTDQAGSGNRSSDRSGDRASTPPVIANGDQLWAGAPLNGIHQDQGISIALPGGRTLWIFADTFQRPGPPRFFVTSAAAVTNPGSWRLNYASTAAGTPVEFLPRTAAEKADAQPGEHYQAVWPTGATQLPDGRVIISYARYRVQLLTKDYQFLGAGLYEYRYRDLDGLLDGGQARRIGSDLWGPGDGGEVRSPVYAGGYVYFDQCQDLRCYPVRSTPAGLTNRASYRWWTGIGWSGNRDQHQAIVVGSSHPGGNASVVRLGSGGYAMADTEIGMVSGTGLLWVSPHPWGPWSRAVSFTFPNCPPVGCYGLNIHPSQSSADQIRISYATGGGLPVVRVYDVPVVIGADAASIRIRY